MPTTVTHTIGVTARDYSTVQLWLDASPANLVSDDKIWRGEAYNDAEFSGAWDASAITTDATRYVDLTVATGQSFYDNASVRSNALRYNQSNGVAASRTANYSAAFNANNMRVSRWQLRQQGSGGIGTGPYLKDVVLHNNGGGTGWGGSNGAVRYNVLMIQDSTTNDGFSCQTAYGGTVTFVGCTAIVPSNITNTTGTGFTATGGTNIMQSCGSFGFSVAASAGGWDGTASKFNATNKASGLPGTNNQHTVTYSSVTPFTQASAGGALDFSSIASTSLAANGFLDGTNAPLDISGYTRANPPTIGHWEITASGGGGGSNWGPWVVGGMSWNRLVQGR